MIVTRNLNAFQGDLNRVGGGVEVATVESIVSAGTIDRVGCHWRLGLGDSRGQGELNALLFKATHDLQVESFAKCEEITRVGWMVAVDDLEIERVVIELVEVNTRRILLSHSFVIV